MRRCLLIALLAGATACAIPTAGLQPERPAAKKAFLSRYTKFVEVESVRPNFRWQSLTAVAGADDITYELRVWEAHRGGVGPLVYRREALVAPRHRIEDDLRHGTRYQWSVRARFVLDGAPRITAWGAAGELSENDTVPNPSCFRFSTPVR